MKKYLLLLLIAISIGIVMPHKLFATDITVGASTWYSWFGGDMPCDKMDPAFMYGPAMAVKFNDDFNLTFVFLYGKYDMKYSDGEKTKLKRTDSDLALNYRLNDIFKVFAGVKYLGASFTGYDMNSFGPGLGVSAAFPIAENLFLIANVSGFHVWGTDKGMNGDDEKENSKRYGFNSTLSLAYYIATASTTISLGGRYQYINNNYDKDKDSNPKNKFYGATLTATYTFSI